MQKTISSRKIAHLRLMLQRAEEVLKDALDSGVGDADEIIGLPLEIVSEAADRHLGHLFEELDEDFCTPCASSDCSCRDAVVIELANPRELV